MLLMLRGFRGSVVGPRGTRCVSRPEGAAHDSPRQRPRGPGASPRLKGGAHTAGGKRPGPPDPPGPPPREGAARGGAGGRADAGGGPPPRFVQTPYRAGVSVVAAVPGALPRAVVCRPFR